MSVYLSVIIPTYNRRDILFKCLGALMDQTCKEIYEVLVIDDGSTDRTKELVESIARNSPYILRYFKQEHKGPAAARNVGIKNAQGEIILFIGDDIIATPTLLEEHSNWHRRYPDDNVAVLGYVSWSPEIEITPFMQWLENGGPQFAFWQVKGKVQVDTQNYFYTSNLSLKRKFLLDNNGFFDEEFPYAAYEDIELGHRLKKAGMILKYNREAVGYHYHYTSLDAACQRKIKVGESSGVLAKKLTEKRDSFLSNKSLIRRILSRCKFCVYYLLAKFYEKKAIKQNIFGYILSYCHYVGARRYKNKNK